ncbi:uncharacterized protein J3R85_020003 [Psidium guajava]|nr:uncharacterized protein J3R85_020003 [Psidium guajava]
MASLPTQIFPADVMSKWEKLYHLLGRGYIYITHHPSVEAEIFVLFREINASSVEGTNLEREYRALSHFAERSVARYKKTFKFAEERVSLLVHEREKLVERLTLNQTYFENDPRDIVMKFRCEWLEGRLDNLIADIAFERDLIDNLKLAVEHHEMNASRYKEKCTHLFFKLTNLDSQIAQCRQSINFMESQLNSFVMIIRAQFGFNFPP